MTAYRFRLLLCLYIVLSVATLAAAFHSSDLISPAMQAASEAEPPAWDVANLPLSLSIVLPLAIGSLAGLAGMFMFKSWARTFSLVFTVLGLVLLPLMGTSVVSWLDSLLAELCAMIWGAILALAYYSSVSKLFSAAPLSGADHS